MFRQQCAIILVLTWLVSISDLSSGEYLVKPVFCTGVSINLRYDRPLPAANSGQTVTAHAADSGVWYPCQLAALQTSISYYLTLTATNANCERATFTNFVFTGFFNCSSLAGLPASAKNLTVPLSDPNTVRNLSQVQPFFGPIVIPLSVTAPCVGVPPVELPLGLTVPGSGSLYSINFTLIFPQQNHQPGTCGQVTSERVQIIPQLFLINTYNLTSSTIVPGVVGECH